ncbi:MAG: ATP-dependent DNA helicase RecG [Bacteroidota bacterium]|nr:ATP-dependent DNA helicase RecG [Bacteroidota bacterium]
MKELQYLKGVGPRRAAALAESGIQTVRDLLFFFPRAYIDRTTTTTLRSLAQTLQKQERLFEEHSTPLLTERLFYNEVTLIVRIEIIREHTYSGNRRMLLATITDDSRSSGNLIFWNRLDYYRRFLQPGQLYLLAGRPTLDRRGAVTFHHPELEPIEPDDEELYRIGRILPKYRLTQTMRQAGLTQSRMRALIAAALDIVLPTLSEPLPEEVRRVENLPELSETLQQLHFPSSAESLHRARLRMKFEEMFLFQLLLALRQRGVRRERGLVFNPKSAHARWLLKQLPFELTRAQKRVLWEIVADLTSGHPMNRLLQGDVGSGKTIVALLTMLVAVDNGYQALFMAPTEILAEQHYHTIRHLLEGSGLSVVQLVGSQNPRLRQELLQQIAQGAAHIVVGTHALFESSVAYCRAGLLVIDEQHRFGVLQRARLRELSRTSLGSDDAVPHVLVMSATPIPRTLSMTLYGDLDVSTLDELPPGRKPVTTKVVFESQLPQVYEFIRNELRSGHQAYVVYPLIEPSEKLELKAATEHHVYLQNEIFPEFRCGLLHGQLSWYEKEEVMRAFARREYHVLVATTVIEVGIDVPNATVMLIQNAERFGLAQLHQLRGRVGRGGEQSYCFLATRDHFRYHWHRAEESRERLAAIVRLRTMEQTTDGFRIAEVDLQLRGPGDLLGTRQSGVPEFQHIDLVTDGDIISRARRAALELVRHDALLQRPEHALLRHTLAKRYGEAAHLLDIA